MTEPTLDDVFMAKTGRSIRDGGGSGGAGGGDERTAA